MPSQKFCILFQPHLVSPWGRVQSVTSYLETSWYRDFSHFFESISIVLEKFGLEKSLRIGLENFQSQKKGSVSVSKIFGLKKVSLSVSKSLVSKSQYWSGKICSKKSLDIGLKNFGLEKSLGISYISK